MMGYFFDSSVIIDVLEGKPACEKFLSEIFFTTVLNLSEVYYYFLRQADERTANYLLNKINFQFLEINSEIGLEAAKFRYDHKKRGLSFIDCIGYTIALKNNLVFLTGDGDFKGKENVEFVK